MKFVEASDSHLEYILVLGPKKFFFNLSEGRGSIFEVELKQLLFALKFVEYKFEIWQPFLKYNHFCLLFFNQDE